MGGIPAAAREVSGESTEYPPRSRSTGLRRGAQAVGLLAMVLFMGFGRELLTRVFGRFERAVTVRNYGGLGLGLWITRSLVEAHGGAVQVASAPGQGSIFTVTLPAR